MSETELVKFAKRLRALPSPSHALRAYIGGVEGLIRLNAEDITAEGWRERWDNLHAINTRRWDALSDEDKQRTRDA